MILLFTFHYGSIQMRPGALHSSGSRDSFTFHYGSIQIAVVKTYVDEALSFTFHYGSIQIVTVAVSNHTLFNFTFHYGSIQIRAWGSRSGDNLPLHSTMVLFKSHAEGPLPRSYNSLHSTMVLFKSFPYPVAALFLHLYIPLWFYSNRKLP